MAYYLGIDVSTTATKAVLVDGTGRVFGVASSEYELATPRPLWAEQDPGLWDDGCTGAIRTVLAESGVDGAEIRGVGLTGQMHGLVLLDEQGEVLRPAILWNDQRSGDECDQMRERVGRAELIRITGNDATPGLTAPKVLWVREHEPATFERIRHVLLPKDYVRYRLTGTFATDRAGAGGTQLLDLASREWSPELASSLGIALSWLPTTHEGPEITGRVSDAAAERTGLRSGTPVVAGGGDQAAQAVGVGVVDPGSVALTLGTSGVVFAACDEPLRDPNGRLNAFPHAVPGRWHVMGVMLSAAGSLRWYRDVVAPDLPYKELLAEAAGVERGAEGLYFSPYLSGERCPHPDPAVRASFVGLTLRHSRGHLTRSVLEGVAFGLRDNLELMREVGLGEVSEIRVSGGGTRNPLWRQILADVLGVRLVSTEQTEGAAYGAALLAGVGAGEWSSVQEACHATVSLEGETRPTEEGRRDYEVLYAGYRRCYPTLRPLYEGAPA